MILLLPESAVLFVFGDSILFWKSRYELRVDRMILGLSTWSLWELSCSIAAIKPSVKIRNPKGHKTASTETTQGCDDHWYNVNLFLRSGNHTGDDTTPGVRSIFRRCQIGALRVLVLPNCDSRGLVQNGSVQGWHGGSAIGQRF